MKNIIKNIMGVGIMNDQAIVTDLQIAAKSAVINYAHAITDISTPEIRNTLLRQLQEAISFQEQVTNYMISKGYYHVYDLTEQLNIDIENANKAIDAEY